MKIKTVISAIAVLAVAGLFSFTNIAEKESSNVALVMTFDGKGDNDGYLVLYGDGTSEQIPFRIKFNNTESALESATIAANMMNVLHNKGYRYVGMSQTGNSAGIYTVPLMVFEKK